MATADKKKNPEKTAPKKKTSTPSRKKKAAPNPDPKASEPEKTADDSIQCIGTGCLEIIERKPAKATGKPPILFIHGAFISAKCWEVYYLDYFAEKGYHAIAISLSGHGASKGGDKLYTLAISDYVKDVASVIATMDQEPILVGHSMGGLIIQDYLKLPGSRAKAAVLMASSPPEGLSRTAPTMLFQHPASCMKLNMINMLPRSMWAEFISAEELRDIFFSKLTSLESIMRFLPMFQHESPMAIFEMTFFDLFTIRKINVPIFVMGGENDIIIPPGFVKYTASFYNTKPVVLENEGHAIMLSDDWKTGADRIIKWLDEIGL
ncbi:alpha/beta hydrolase [Desulforegula conservatrix]|uniref:alpha/beta hydrolase n=1 Tax=Desulforegula conservatrix TaxID=153026 RepID=UPI00041E44D0|nr:alpha/beta hydrolase [Desulforegula conservatrix]